VRDVRGVAVEADGDDVEPRGDIVQVVVPKGSDLRLDADVSSTDGDNNCTSTQTVPEPASVALLGLGGLAAIGRRRRRA